MARRSARSDGIDRNACPDGLWWVRGALCFALRALGELLGVVEGSSGAKVGAQGCPNEKFGDVGVPPGAPKSTKRAPNTPPGAPKRSPREPPNGFKTTFGSKPFFINVNISERKSRFLRVGGSACELTIDAKMHRKKIKYDIEERRNKINEHEQEEASKRGPT